MWPILVPSLYYFNQSTKGTYVRDWKRAIVICNLMSLSDSIVFYYYNKNHTRVSVANYFFLLYFFLWFSLMHYNDLIYKFLLLWEVCFNFQLFKKFSLIKYLLLSYLGFSGWNTGLVQLNSWRNIAGSKHILVSFFFCTFFFDFH